MRIAIVRPDPLLNPVPARWSHGVASRARHDPESNPYRRRCRCSRFGPRTSVNRTLERLLASAARETQRKVASTLHLD
jgi:hypothetical protein